MKDDSGRIRKLFRKYLADECSPEEKAEVMAWFDREENEQVLKELIRSEFEQEIPVRENSVRVQQEVYRNFDWVLPAEETRRLRWRLPRISRLTAAAILLGAVFSLAAIVYLYTSKLSFPGNAEMTSTAVGERKRVKLEDGSVVWLNAASRLSYPRRFTGSVREVTLEGEAFFDIARNADQPFVIKSGALKTTVLGTSFNIRAYLEDKTMSVAVVTGKVKVNSAEAELHLEPNQQAVFDKKHHKLDKRQEMFVSEMVSWKEGMLRFRNTTFPEVATVLKRTRGVDIRYDRHLENCPIIHADFDENDSLENILGTLMMAVNGSVEKTDDGVYHLASDVDCRP